MDFCSQPPTGVSALLTSLQSGQDNKIHAASCSKEAPRAGLQAPEDILPSPLCPDSPLMPTPLSSGLLGAWASLLSRGLCEVGADKLGDITCPAGDSF